MGRVEVTSLLRFIVLICTINIACLTAGSSMDGMPVVNTTYGPIIGTFRDSNAGAPVFSFFGIPFAQPPLGSLRWRAPVRPRPWVKPIDLSSKPTVSDACLQVPLKAGANTEGTEDCLKIHAHTPRLPDQGGHALAVMLWIHGGGFASGDAWLQGLYDGLELAQRFRVVVFAAQYRLGTLGFLALEQLQREDRHHSTGNYGVMDQRAAMQWVRDNAAFFGGDPQRVTIFGESAGGESMCYHLVSPASYGLFDAAIMESGSCDLQFYSVAERQKHWRALNNRTSCAWGLPGYLDCLRAMDASDVQGIIAAPLSLTPESAVGTFYNVVRSGPTIDGTHAGLPDMPARMLGSGMFNKVPVILGVNNFELQLLCKDKAHVEKCGFMGSFVNYSLPNTHQIRQWLESVFQRTFSDTQWDEILEMYPLEDFDGNVGSRVSAMVTDAGYAGPHGRSAWIGECETLRAASDIARAGVPVWMYRMKRLGSVGFVQHFTEVAFIFQQTHPALSHDDSSISNLIGAYWTNLAKFHDPNGAAMSDKEHPFWPVLNASSPVLAIFNGTTQKVAPSERAPFCKFWQRLLDDPSMEGEREYTIVV